MRRVFVFWMLITLLLMNINQSNAHAETQTTIDIDWFTVEECSEQTANIEFEYGEIEETHGAFVDFAVSADGRFAVILQQWGRNYVNVYGPDSKFLFCYTYKGNKHQDVHWDANGLGIYFSRACMVLFFSEDGECIGGGTWENNLQSRTFMRDSVRAQSQEVSGYRYYSSSELERIRSYDEQLFLFRERDGEREIIYQADVDDEKMQEGKRSKKEFVVGLLIVSLGFFVMVLAHKPWRK